MITPTIGRVVWYWTGDTSQLQPQAALVTYVYSDLHVNLAVFNENGMHSAQPSVYLWQGDGDRPTDRFAEWMPYQKGQAAKTEALEKQVAGA